MTSRVPAILMCCCRLLRMATRKSTERTVHAIYINISCTCIHNVDIRTLLWNRSNTLCIIASKLPVNIHVISLAWLIYVVSVQVP